MTLETWIEKTGPKNVAKALRVDPSTVSQWRRRKSSMRPKTMVRVHKLTAGKVSYQDMIHHFANVRIK